jgi:hypothetical protein
VLFIIINLTYMYDMVGYIYDSYNNNIVEEDLELTALDYIYLVMRDIISMTQ